MNLFKRRKANRVIRNDLVIRMGRAIEQKQRKVAGFLGRKTQYWNRDSKIIALTLFCLLFGSCCLLLLIKSIIHF